MWASFRGVHGGRMREQRDVLSETMHPAIAAPAATAAELGGKKLSKYRGKYRGKNRSDVIRKLEIKGLHCQTAL
jgi:hypothetical protein